MRYNIEKVIQVLARIIEETTIAEEVKQWVWLDVDNEEVQEILNFSCHLIAGQVFRKYFWFFFACYKRSFPFISDIGILNTLTLSKQF